MPRRASSPRPPPSGRASRSSSSRHSPRPLARVRSSAGCVPGWTTSTLAPGSRALRSFRERRNRRKACPRWRRGLGSSLRKSRRIGQRGSRAIVGLRLTLRTHCTKEVYSFSGKFLLEVICYHVYLWSYVNASVLNHHLKSLRSGIQLERSILRDQRRGSGHDRIYDR